ncbi:exopolysaccharide biosynthesis protein [Pseudoroseicyclus tamaricis]|uniref:Exopolysaccharide biosynthesis protein n=1 Tax=Pseudoroseicyclus tamaricis TaxID=2705421 RepID=A0A6B2JVQ7_9RHOB|nr:exopolysaccharide biosynthesis protein [Pseudoroseicyclus tamaricis]NDV00294.1 exopolysaccharide biosynthesis protein [Pseudoroseicyclus tamaricis]
MTDSANAQGDQGDARSVDEILDRMESAADGQDETALGDVVEALGDASFVPLLFAPALAVVTPLSGIPLFSSTCGILIVLVTAQMLLHRKHLWLPGWIMRREVPSKRLTGAVSWMRKPAQFMDRISKPRLSVFVAKPFEWVTVGACLLCGAVMPPLEFVPFSSSIMGAAVVFFSLGLLVRDGLFSLIAIFIIGIAGYTIYNFLA